MHATMSRFIAGNEENIPVMRDKEEKQGKLLNKLPPNVSGSSRGFLDLSLDRIQWNVTNYTNITARIIWWGESYEEATTIKITASSRNCINYAVCTNTRLFRKYLSSCEAIEVQFSATTKGVVRQIGTAFISLPEALLRQGNDFFAPMLYTGSHKIFSPKNTTVGMLKVTIKLVLFEEIEKFDPLSEKNEIRASVKDYSIYKKEPLCLRPDSAASNSSKVWSFLRGRQMSPKDEATTLRELTQSSPANSVIEAMDEELTWKLREFYAKKGRQGEREGTGYNKCHNPGEKAEKEHSNEAPPPTASNSSANGTASNGSAAGASYGGQQKKTGEEEKKESEGNEDLKTKENSEEEDYHGIFYIGGFRNLHPHNRVPKVFAIAKSISNVDESIIKTHLSDQNLFLNYLKIFPIRIEESHLERMMKQNTLTVELWTRPEGEQGQDVKLGSVAVGLHQFYVAFRHEIVRKRLFDLSMPVIALDGWAMVQGADGSSIGELEIVLAMGTKQQVDYFVQTKHLLHRRMEISAPASARSETASILSSFLENLSQQIAASATRQQNDQQPPPKRGELRKTSDLLDVLSKSLSSPQPPVMMDGLFTRGPVNGEAAVSTRPRDVPDGNVKEEFLKISLEIESAMHLPKIPKGNESGKKRGLKMGTDQLDGDTEPSAYVTFEARLAEDGLQDIVESVEGKVYATHVVEKSSNPVWNEEFTVEIPKDLLTHPEKYFIIKVWRKTADSLNLRATPLEDVVIGFCTVDLKVLTAGLPEIAGCYNIVYFDGKCNGQLQMKLKPLEAIQHKDVLDTAEMRAEDSPVSMMLDLSLGADLSLSRTLKRKFTELDEITQRLRARLHDVTSSDLISSDDEFENDLNTSVDEVDEEPLVEVEGEKKEEQVDAVDAVKDDFNWLGNLTDLQRQFVEIDRQLQKNSQTLNELLDRNGGTPSTSTATNSANNLYTTNGGLAVESLETALKDAMLNDRPDTA